MATFKDIKGSEKDNKSKGMPVRKGQGGKKGC
jgi:hypothetical protein